MKIGVITFHRAINYGAVLQTYALQKRINEKGYKCEVIDYQCDAFKDGYKAFKIYSKSLKGIVSSIIQYPYKTNKNRKFKDFINKKISISKEFYVSSNICRTNDIYSKFIVGSDQVWNCNLTNFDKTYFLDFVKKDEMKNSYAASFGFSEIPEDKISDYKSALSGYNYLSVREHSGQYMVNELINRKATIVLDPVFLLSSDQWGKIAVQPNLNEKYILIYYLNDIKVFEQAKKLSEITGYKVVCIQNSMKRPIKAKYINNAGPEEFLGWFKNATYVITDSFHGTAFSIIFKKQFWALLNTSKDNKNSRIISVLEQMNLEDRILTVNKQIDINIRIDYNYIEKNVNKAIKNSEEFIDSILE